MNEAFIHDYLCPVREYAARGTGHIFFYQCMKCSQLCSVVGTASRLHSFQTSITYRLLWRLLKITPMSDHSAVRCQCLIPMQCLYPEAVQDNHYFQAILSMFFSTKCLLPYFTQALSVRLFIINNCQLT